MAILRRGQAKQIKKDSNVQRETLDDIGSEIVQERSAELSQSEPRPGTRRLGPIRTPNG
jgi:hypothetical protein